MHIRLIMGKTVRMLINILLAAVFFIPFYWLLLTSVKSLGQTLQFPPSFWVENPQWQNYIRAFQSIPFLAMLKNSAIVTAGILVCQTVTVIPAAYAFARFRFRGNNIIFGAIISTMMIPAQLIFLPIFVMFSGMGLINSYVSLILPSASSAFAIFMLRQTFKQVPSELIEAARLDKAGELKIMLRIMLPIAKPTIITLGLITFISSWNDYFWPFVLTTNNAVRTLAVGITSLQQTEGTLNYHTLMAGNALLIAPVLIVFFFAQKQIIKAFTYLGDK